MYRKLINMSSISCTIELENDRVCYRPGEVIKGLVILNVCGGSTILLKAVSVHFAGFAHTNWETPEIRKRFRKPQPRTSCESREDYVSTTNFLIGSEMANPKTIEPGKYNYNFMINIPRNIPSTFDSPLGCIQYELAVHADENVLSNLPITIEQIKDLRLIDPAVQLPGEIQQMEQKSCIKFWQQPLQLNISIPQKAFIVGECISVSIRLTNLAHLKLSTITSNLNRITHYKGRIQENCTLESNDCKCISLSYEVEVMAACQTIGRRVVAKMPILIGTISLKSDIKVMPLNLNNNNNVSTIAVARSMEELTLPSAMDLQDHIQVMETSYLTSSKSSLASSFKEADFMAAVHLNKKRRHQILGDISEFKPKYLYFELPE